jgi:predicted transcriptional regulator of viral defense system
MNYLAFRNSMKDFTVFSLRDILRVEPGFHRRRLNEWQAKGYIRKVIKGFYNFSDLPLDEMVLFEIANRIYKPSYVSLESALAHYQLIPESVFGVTSISTRRTYRFTSGLAEFRFRTVKPELFFGYVLVPAHGKRVKIARPEKAVLDFLYLNPALRSGPDFESLRIDADRFFRTVSVRTLRAAAVRFSRKAFAVRVDRFLEHLRNRI